MRSHGCWTPPLQRKRCPSAHLSAANSIIVRSFLRSGFPNNCCRRTQSRELFFLIASLFVLEKNAADNRFRLYCVLVTSQFPSKSGTLTAAAVCKKVPPMHDRGSILHAFKRYLFFGACCSAGCFAPGFTPREAASKHTEHFARRC